MQYLLIALLGAVVSLAYVVWRIQEVLCKVTDQVSYLESRFRTLEKDKRYADRIFDDYERIIKEYVAEDEQVVDVECWACGIDIRIIDVHCPFCSAKNRHFDQQAFVAINHKTPAEFSLENCLAHHQKLLRQNKEIGKDVEPFGACNVCGVELNPLRRDQG